MENPPPDSITPIILKINIKCCDECAKKTEKIIDNIDGVYSVNVYKESNLAIVIGNVDSKTLIDALNNKGKKAQLGCVEDLKQCTKKNIRRGGDDRAEDNRDGVGVAATRERCHQEEDNTVAGDDNCPQTGYVEHRRERKEHKGKKCYCNGDPNYNKEKKDEDDHVVENFVEARYQEFEEDEEICKDRFCATHRRKHSSVPPPVHDRPPMYWEPVGGLGSGYFSLRNSQGPLSSIREFPPLPLPPFRPFSNIPSPYGYASPSMPPPGRSRRPFGNHYYGDYGW